MHRYKPWNGVHADKTPSTTNGGWYSLDVEAQRAPALQQTSPGTVKPGGNSIWHPPPTLKQGSTHPSHFLLFHSYLFLSLPPFSTFLRASSLLLLSLATNYPSSSCKLNSHPPWNNAGTRAGTTPSPFAPPPSLSAPHHVASGPPAIPVSTTLPIQLPLLSSPPLHIGSVGCRWSAVRQIGLESTALITRYLQLVQTRNGRVRSTNGRGVVCFSILMRRSLANWATMIPRPANLSPLFFDSIVSERIERISCLNYSLPDIVSTGKRRIF